MRRPVYLYNFVIVVAAAAGVVVVVVVAVHDYCAAGKLIKRVELCRKFQI